MSSAKRPTITMPTIVDEFPVITFKYLLDKVTSGVYTSFPATIRPLVADAVLAEFNTHNRKPTERKIALYARDMTAGKWKAKCGQPISFNVKSELDNGQNRLMASVRAGQPFPTLVVVGNDADAFDVIDRGKIRTTADTLSYHHEINTSNLSALARMMVQWEATGLAKNCDPTEAEIMAAVDRHPGLRDAVNTAKEIVRRIGGAPTPAGLAVYLISRQAPETLPPFLDRLKTGINLDEGDPILLLREAIRKRKERGGNKKGASTYDAAIFIKAWNAHVDGRKIGLLSYKEGERFPVVK